MPLRTAYIPTGRICVNSVPESDVVGELDPGHSFIAYFFRQLPGVMFSRFLKKL